MEEQKKETKHDQMNFILSRLVIIVAFVLLSFYLERSREKPVEEKEEKPVNYSLPPEPSEANCVLVEDASSHGSKCYEICTEETNKVILMKPAECPEPI